MKTMPITAQEEIRVQIANNARMWRNLLICGALGILFFWTPLAYFIARALA